MQKKKEGEQNTALCHIDAILIFRYYYIHLRDGFGPKKRFHSLLYLLLAIRLVVSDYEGNSM